MPPNSQITIYIGKPVEEARDLIKNALEQVGLAVTSVDTSRNVIFAKSETSWKSFGENIVVSIMPKDFGCDVNFYSETALSTTLFDWGRNKDNVDRFVKEMKKHEIFPPIITTERVTENKMANTVVIQTSGNYSTESPIKILFLSACPSDTPTLKLDEEVRSIDHAIRQTEFRDLFDLKQQWAVRVADLQGYLLRHKPDIVHFSGHGSKSSEIILEDINGHSLPVSSQALKRLFSVLKGKIRCIVLNACYSEEQAMALADQIDCVIGMSTAIEDVAAISFSSAFYQALGYGCDVKTAFELGCVQIDLELLGDENIPRLLALRSDPSKISFV